MNEQEKIVAEELEIKYCKMIKCKYERGRERLSKKVVRETRIDSTRKRAIKRKSARLKMENEKYSEQRKDVKKSNNDFVMVYDQRKTCYKPYPLGKR